MFIKLPVRDGKKTSEEKDNETILLKYVLQICNVNSVIISASSTLISYLPNLLKIRFS